MCGSALQASIASVVNHTVRLPRARRPASYSAQLVTRCRCFGMWRRQAALALNGTAGVQASGRGRRPTPPSSRRQPADPCNKVLRRAKSASGTHPRAILIAPKPAGETGVRGRVHASNRSDSRARLTTTRLGSETGAYLSADESLKLPDLA